MWLDTCPCWCCVLLSRKLAVSSLLLLRPAPWYWSLLANTPVPTFVTQRVGMAERWNGWKGGISVSLGLLYMNKHRGARRVWNPICCIAYTSNLPLLPADTKTLCWCLQIHEHKRHVTLKSMFFSHFVFFSLDGVVGWIVACDRIHTI